MECSSVTLQLLIASGALTSARNAVAVEELLRQLRYKNEPYFEAVAPKGIGVFDTLKACAKQVLIELSRK